MIRKANEETDQEARSLLQKAIRRGFGDIVEAVFHYLAARKDEFKWVRSRLAVLTFEENWPYGLKVSFGRSESEILSHLLALSSHKKNKDAAGLGSLSFAFSEGDNTVLTGDSERDWYIRTIAKALKEKEKFISWIQAEALRVGDDRKTLIANAIDGSKKAGWPWDKAFAYAAAVLALTKRLPEIKRIEFIQGRIFPFWVAIDKHTSRGKEAIRSAAAQMNIPANTALWISFYCESAICSDQCNSYWWHREKEWRLSKLGISETAALNTWGKLRVVVQHTLSSASNELESRVMQHLACKAVQPKAKAVQQNLF